MYNRSRFTELADELAAIGRWADSKGWTPATSSNLSARIDAETVAVTVSGKHKGRLTADDFMVVDLDGQPLTPQKPSAETLLHTFLYKMDPAIGAVLHVHSPYCTVLSQTLSGQTDWLLQDWELLKAFAGVHTHESLVKIPIFGNSQDILQLANEVDVRLKSACDAPAYLIQGHGVYTWGTNIADALRHLEAVEYLAQCELELRRHKS